MGKYVNLSKPKVRNNTLQRVTLSEITALSHANVIFAKNIKSYNMKFNFSLRVSALFIFLQIHLNGQVTLTQSNLPVVLIDTHGEQIVDDPKINADMKIIYNGQDKMNNITDSVYHFDGKIGIEFRGSTSQSFPKKPYGFELQDNAGEELEVSLLGMPKESDWTFNATYNDKTLMRDGLTYILAGSFMEYAPRVRYTELMINGQYQGIYLLIEKIKRGKNRVNIAKMKNTDNSGDALTGGYIIKIDKETGSNSGEGWTSHHAPFPDAWQRTFFQYEYPKNKNITAEQKNYISNHVTMIENVLAGTDFANPESGYRKYIDTRSLMDYIIVNELTKNPDAYRLSTFFYKQRDSEGGKIKFGPVWDYNLALGNVDYCTQGDPEGLVIEEFNKVCPGDGWVIPFWWNRVLEDSTFYRDLKLRWKELRNNQLSDLKIFGTVDSLAMLVYQAKDRNFIKWPVLGEYVWPNYFVGQTYDEEIVFLSDWLEKRLAYLDDKWKIETVNTVELPGNKVLLSPNPVTDMTQLRMNTLSSVIKPISVLDINGQIVQIPVIYTGENELSYDFSLCKQGVYFIRYLNDNNILVSKIVKL